MSALAIVLRAAALLALLLISGFALARASGRRADVFDAVWCGLALVSLVGTLLARAGHFSLLTIGGTVGCVAAVGLLIARGRRVATAPSPSATPGVRRIRVLAAAAGCAAALWASPPYETFIGAADSTMYLNAGVHLARTGSYEVPGTIAPLLAPDLAKAVFASVGVLDRGPYVRLPGGLLMTHRDAATAVPAFFPLVSTWTGILTAVGGPACAPAVAPLAIGLAVWALALFAGETFGLATAAITALVFVGNFAVWWFGRFTMSEPLTIAFIWGALVFLGRGAPGAAGSMLALAGLARAETLVFALMAGAWWVAWVPVRARDLGLLAGGLVMTGLVAATSLVGMPNHHVAYLWNDASLALLRWMFLLEPARVDGRFAAAVALLPMLPLLLVVAVSAMGLGTVRNVARVLVTAAIVLAVVAYARLFLGLDTVRHIGWLATSMSPLGLLCAVVGMGFVWSRGGPAGRLAVALTILVAAVFLPSPRVAAYQPWAMRRYLPVVLPGLALAAGTALGACLESPRRWLQGIGVVLVITTLALQLPPTLVARRAGYFADTLAGMTQLAERIPPDALVVVDGGFADLQLQVPLWLTFGRESIAAAGGGPAWRALLTTLLATGRPVYWIQNRYGLPPTGPGMTFVPVEGIRDLTITLPDSPRDTPPALVIRKLVPLGVYGVKSTG